MRDGMIQITVSNSYNIRKAIEQRMEQVRSAMKRAKYSMTNMVQTAKEVHNTVMEYRDEKKKQREINKRFIKVANMGGDAVKDIIKEETTQVIDIKNNANITDAGFKNTSKLQKLKKEMDASEKEDNKEKAISL